MLIFGLVAICVCRSSNFLISQLRDNLYATLIYAGVFIFIPASRPLATCLLILFFAYQLYLLNSVAKQGEMRPHQLPYPQPLDCLYCL